MRYIASVIFLLSFLPAAKAQNYWINVDAGVANYDGELQTRRYTFQECHPAGGLGIGYEFNPNWSVSTGFLLTRISGNDKYSPNHGDVLRNLNFTSNLFEWNVRAEYTLFDLEDRTFSPYGFLGLAVFHFNPYTYSPTGQTVYLRPLSTEGEGLAAYPDRKPYHLTQVSIPFGIGLKMALSDNVRIGLEIGLRKTFTGYLDDVSKSYVDEATLNAAKGGEAVAYAFRQNELPGHGNDVYPPAGTPRGTGHTDWYYITAIRASFRIGGGSFTTKKYLRCPTNVSKAVH